MDFRIVKSVSVQLQNAPLNFCKPKIFLFLAQKLLSPAQNMTQDLTVDGVKF